MQAGSALLRIPVPILIGTLAALLAILTTLLLLLATLFLVAVRLRVLLVLLVGVVSHFPYSCCRAMPSCRDLSATRRGSRCCGTSPDRGQSGMGPSHMGNRPASDRFVR